MTDYFSNLGNIALNAGMQYRRDLERAVRRDFECCLMLGSVASLSLPSPTVHLPWLTWLLLGGLFGYRGFRRGKTALVV